MQEGNSAVKKATFLGFEKKMREKKKKETRK